MEWRDIESAPKDGTQFWGNVDGDAIKMIWHPKFEAFVSSWRRMIMAKGYTVNGEPYEDHSPEIHSPTHWMPLIPSPPPANTGHDATE